MPSHTFCYHQLFVGIEVKTFEFAKHKNAIRVNDANIGMTFFFKLPHENRERTKKLNLSIF